jgi:competence protein ComEA
LDLNTADVAALDALPGVGPARARAIVGYREANGPFHAMQELARVPGIGPAALARLAGLVRVGGP